MALTFRSTVAETRTITEVLADGSRRTGTATKDGNVWRFRIEDPGCDVWEKSKSCRDTEVIPMLSNAMDTRRHEFDNARARGFAKPVRIEHQPYTISPLDPRYVR